MTNEEFKALLGEIGLETCSSGDDYERMLEDPAAIEKAIEQAKFFGVEYIGIGTPCPGNCVKARAATDNTPKASIRSQPNLERKSKKLLYHNHA